MFYVYLIQNVDNPDDFYLGCSHDLKARLKEHNEGRCKSTKYKRWRVIYYEAFLTLSCARTREYRLKHDGRARRQLMERINGSLETE